LFPIVGINETEIVLLIKLYSPESYLQPSSLSRVYVEVEPTSESLSLGPYNVNNKTPILGFIRDTLKLNIEGLTLICNENIIGEEDIFSKLIIEDADISNLSEINIQSLKDTVVEMAEVGSNIEDESSTF